MNRFRLGRPSPAMVVASTALFISLGGVSYGVATGSIDSRELKNNTVRSKDIRNNTVLGRDIRRNAVYGSDVRQATLTGADVRNASLTGADVRNDSLTGTDLVESTLGTVPSAGSAGFAASAGTAATAGSLSSQAKLGYQAAAGTGGVTVFDNGKLKLSASCAGGSAVTVTANTTVDNATLQTVGTVTADTNDGDFDTGETLTLSSDTEERNVVYTEPGGQVAVVQYAAVEGGAYGGAQGCVVKGLAQTL
jgi:Pentapeptide repeats (8 copies)